MRRPLLLLVGLGLALTGCPGKKTQPPKTSADDGSGEKTDAPPSKKTVAKPKPKPRYKPPATRAFKLDLKLRTKQGKQNVSHALTLTRDPVEGTRRVRLTVGGIGGGTHASELEVEGDVLTGGRDVALLGLVQQVSKEGRRLVPPPGGRTVYLGRGGWLQQKHERVKQLDGVRPFAGRDCHGVRVSGVTRGQLPSGEPFKGQVQCEVWQDAETLEALALRGSVELQLRYRGRLRLSYSLTPAEDKPAQGTPGGSWSKRFEDPQDRELAQAVSAGLLASAMVATRKNLNKASNWVPLAVAAAGVGHTGSLLLAKALRLRAGTVQAHTREKARTFVSYVPKTKPTAAGTTATSLEPVVVTDAEDWVLRIGKGNVARAVYVTKQAFARLKQGSSYSLEQEPGRLEDKHALRVATLEERKLLEAARKEGRPLAKASD